MSRWRFYFEHSLVGYFCKRAKEKWFAAQPSISSGQLNYHNVILQLDCLSAGMRQLLLEGRYEAAELKLLSSMLSPSDRVLEIGGAIGFIGLFCQKVLNVKSVVSVEPNPKTISYLKRNYELNGLTPKIIEAALAPADGPVTFYADDMFWADSLVKPVKETNSPALTVPGLTFDSIWQRANMTFNALIIDVEGAEQYLPVHAIPDEVKKVMIEIHPRTIGTRAAYRVLETLIHSGFEVHGHDTDSWLLIRT